MHQAPLGIKLSKSNFFVWLIKLKQGHKLLTTCEFVRKNWRNVPDNRETASGKQLVTPALKHKQEKMLRNMKLF